MSNRTVDDVLVVGAGVIGTSIAWRLAQRGVNVTVVDPAPGSGATGTAAGMLAPVTELHWGEEPLLRLNLASASRYPDFVDELESATGTPVDYRSEGTVVAAWDAADLAELRQLHELHDRLGLGSRMLDPAELRAMEPGLAPGLPGGLHAATDHSVDPRRLHQALRIAAEQLGAQFVHDHARQVVTDGAGRALGVATAAGERLDAATTVVAAGAWSPCLAGLPADLVPVRPVKGQTLVLAATDRDPMPVRNVLRGRVRSVPVYLVPRDGGGVVIGASCEEAGYDLNPRAGVVHELLRDAQALLPVIAEMTLVEVRTGLRPGSPDNAPLLGAVPGIDGLVLATGHYRNGVLLAPVSADAVAELVVDGRTPPEIASFSPARFLPVASGAA